MLMPQDEYNFKRDMIWNAADRWFNKKELLALQAILQETDRLIRYTPDKKDSKGEANDLRDMQG